MIKKEDLEIGKEFYVFVAAVFEPSKYILCKVHKILKTKVHFKSPGNGIIDIYFIDLDRVYTLKDYEAIQKRNCAKSKFNQLSKKVESLGTSNIEDINKLIERFIK